MQTRVYTVSRLLLALILMVFGLNQFLHFMPSPEPPADGGAFLGALHQSGYVFPALGLVFVGAAALLFLDRAVGLGLVLLAPMTVNILLYHVRFDLAGSGPGLLIAVLQVVVASCVWAQFRGLWESRPAAQGATGTT